MFQEDVVIDGDSQPRFAWVGAGDSDAGQDG
jgi:hypothetical protein